MLVADLYFASINHSFYKQGINCIINIIKVKITKVAKHKVEAILATIHQMVCGWRRKTFPDKMIETSMNSILSPNTLQGCTDKIFRLARKLFL